MKKILTILPLLAALFCAAGCSDGGGGGGSSGDVSAGGTYSKTLSVDLSSSPLKSDAFSVGDDVSDMMVQNTIYASSRAATAARSASTSGAESGIEATVTEVTTTKLGVKIEFTAPSTDSTVSISMYIPAGKTESGEPAVVNVTKVTVGSGAGGSISEASISNLSSLSHPATSDFKGAILRMPYVVAAGENFSDDDDSVTVAASATGYNKINDTGTSYTPYLFVNYTISYNGKSKSFTLLEQESSGTISYDASTGKIFIENAHDKSIQGTLVTYNSRYLMYEDNPATRKSGSGSGLFATFESEDDDETTSITFNKDGSITGTVTDEDGMRLISGTFTNDGGIINASIIFVDKDYNAAAVANDNVVFIYDGTQLYYGEAYTKISALPTAEYTSETAFSNAIVEFLADAVGGSRALAATDKIFARQK